MNLLENTKTYLVGHMQYLSGRNWREARHLISPQASQQGLFFQNQEAP